jgi:hypothetical protein
MSANKAQQLTIDDVTNGCAAQPRTVVHSRSPRVQQLHDYWQSKRAGRIIPGRAEIEPSEIKPLLPNVLITDLFADPVRARYRLAGTKICESFGFNITGCWLHDLNVTADLPFWIAQYTRMMTSQAPVFGSTTGTQWHSEVFRADWALFPLSSDGKHVDQALEIEDWIKARPTARYDDETIIWRVVAFS